MQGPLPFLRHDEDAGAAAVARHDEDAVSRDEDAAAAAEIGNEAVAAGIEDETMVAVLETELGTEGSIGNDSLFLRFRALLVKPAELSK